LQQYNKMLQKLNIKRDRIADIQSAIVAADANNDSQIEYDEWKEELMAYVYMLQKSLNTMKFIFEPLIHFTNNYYTCTTIQFSYII